MSVEEIAKILHDEIKAPTGSFSVWVWGSEEPYRIRVYYAPSVELYFSALPADFMGVEVEALPSSLH